MIRPDGPAEQIQLFPVHADLPSAAARVVASAAVPAAEKSALLDRAYDEYVKRVDGGEPLDPDEFCRRFTVFKTSLRKLIETHQFLVENPHYIDKLDAARWPRPGDTFLSFTLIGELGRGAFARVFLAREPALGGRMVALKLSALHGRAEAETLGRLAHPHIVPVHSVNVDARTGLAAICMPYLGRATLCDVLDRAFADGKPPHYARTILEAIHRLDAGEDRPACDERPSAVLRRGSYIDGVIALAGQLAQALAFVHARGISHRDLKPSNVLLTPAGRPMLLDFNLSAAERGHDGRPGVLLGGTLPYMAPEQLRAMGRNGDQTATGPAADLFSFGVILYELLTGVHPFGPVSLKDPASRLRGQLIERQEHGPRPIRRLNPRVDAQLARLVARCLAFEPHARPRSANEVLAELRRASTPLRQLRRWAGTHARTVLAAGLLLITTAATTAAWLSTREPYAARQMNAGRRHFQQGDHAAAVDHFSRALAAEPAAAEALLARGRAYLRFDRDAQSPAKRALALSDFQAADQLQPNDPRIKACIAYCLSLSTKHREAAALCEYALGAGLVSAELHNNLGYSYLRQNQFDAAERHLSEALRLNPNLAQAWHNRAMLDHQRANVRNREQTTAMTDIARAVQLGPPSARLYGDTARIYARALMLPEAVEHLGLAVRHGFHLQTSLADGSFDALKSLPQFEQLMRTAPGPETHAPLPVVDPLGEDLP